MHIEGENLISGFGFDFNFDFDFVNGFGGSGIGEKSLSRHVDSVVAVESHVFVRRVGEKFRVSVGVGGDIVVSIGAEMVKGNGFLAIVEELRMLFRLLLLLLLWPMVPLVPRKKPDDCCWDFVPDAVEVEEDLVKSWRKEARQAMMSAVKERRRSENLVSHTYQGTRGVGKYD